MDHAVTGARLTRWWRRNALALGALVVLVPASLFAYDALGFGAVRNAELTVSGDEPHAMGGMPAAAALGPVTISPLERDEVGAPRGSDPVLVTIRVDPGEGLSSCRGVTVTEPSTGRQWRTVFTGLTWVQEQGQEMSCVSDAVIPYDVVAPVLLSDDVVGPLVVTITTFDQPTGAVLDLRFTVEQ